MRGHSTPHGIDVAARIVMYAINLPTDPPPPRLPEQWPAPPPLPVEPPFEPPIEPPLPLPVEPGDPTE